MILLKRVFACFTLACLSLAVIGVLALFAIDVESFRMIFGKWFVLEVVVVAALWYPFIRRRLT